MVSTVVLAVIETLAVAVALVAVVTVVVAVAVAVIVTGYEVTVVKVCW